MNRARIAIVGGGLSGLYAAYLLEQRGITDYVVLEARDVPGGRIASTPPVTGTGDRFDLGPTWFWPGLQPQLDQLVRDLGLERFEQFERGDMLIEQSPTSAPVRMPGYLTSPTSFRLQGGMGALVDALHLRLDSGRVRTGMEVRSILLADKVVQLDCVGVPAAASSATPTQSHSWQVAHVLLAMPPRLLATNVAFSPALPSPLVDAWRTTDTWMAPHAKYVAIYPTPFWREQGLSGEARSARGPLTEIHDASMPGGSAALFGFFGVPAPVRGSLSAADLAAACRAQLARMFGAPAAAPKQEFIKDWAQEPHTTTAADLQQGGQHARAPASTAATGPWQGHFTGIASEWSAQFPGYLAGAIDAASLGVSGLTKSL